MPSWFACLAVVHWDGFLRAPASQYGESPMQCNTLASSPLLAATAHAKAHNRQHGELMGGGTGEALPVNAHNNVHNRPT
jgi:hypothetical protein